MRDYVFINEDGTVHNILNLVGPEAILENEDLRDLLHFDYTDWDYDDRPAADWAYSKDTNMWTRSVPLITNVVVENIAPITAPIAAIPIVEPESIITNGGQ